MKDVGGKLYTFADHISEEDKKRLKCSSTCAYKYTDTDKQEQKFCFKPGNLESECRNGGQGSAASDITIQNAIQFGYCAGGITFKNNEPPPVDFFY